MLTAIRPNIAQGIDSLSNFKRDSDSFLNRLQKSGEPLILTVNGKPEAVMLSPDAYQDMVEQCETVKAVRQSMKSFQRGTGKKARQAFSALRKKHHIAKNT